jgi:hypothetical protein
MRSDVTGVTALLEASRFEVREWSVTRGERPTAAPGQSIVWIVMPPSRREGREPSKEEMTLVRTVQGLIETGESVMINYNPSLMQRYRLRDPWQALTRDFHVEPQTQHVIFNAVAAAEGATEFRGELVIDTLDADHPVSRAAHGQQTYFPIPVPIAIEEKLNVDSIALVEAQPNARRWLEDDWARAMTAGDVARGEPFETPQAIMAGAERSNPETGRRQRVLLVGSGGWLRSFVTEVATTLGGQRVALTNPGNHELMLASVAWLAGMDDLIAPSAVGRGLVRLEGIDQGVATRWGVITVIFAPLFCLLVGMGVWILRR